MHSKLLVKYISIHHPNNQKELKKQWSKKQIFIFFSFFVCVFLLATLCYCASFIAFYSLNLPSISIPFSRNLPESTLIYDKYGNVLYSVYDSQNRIYVSLHEIPIQMRMATLAAEDINFYAEDGINPLAIARSTIFDIFSSQSNTNLQGASTITQQLVKYTELSESRTIERKIKEIIITLKISQVYSKDKILEAYMNAINYGGDTYGIEAASRAYFGKDVAYLDLAQSAFLAGLPQSPGEYAALLAPNDPTKTMQENIQLREDALSLAIQRQHYVLEQMLKYKYITGVTTKEVNAAIHENLEFTISEPFNQSTQLQYPDFVLYVRDELYGMYGEEKVNTEGLKVYTTLDPHIQDIGQQAVTTGVEKILAEGLNVHNASLLAMDATNGDILAMVGSANYNAPSGEVNMTIEPISPGSSVKPFVYLTAFEKGMTPDTIVQDTYASIPASYKSLRDDDGAYLGSISIKEALLQSRNIPAVDVAASVGIDNVEQTMLEAGLTSLEGQFFGLSSAIGSNDVPLLEHTAAYLTLSQDGIKHPYKSILLIKDKYGNTIFNNVNVQSSQVFDPKYVKEINSILKDYFTLAPVKAKGYIVAGKTGTSQDNKSNLFMGYSSHLVVGVWAGNTPFSFTTNNTFGEDTAAPIWNNFMLQVLPLFPEDGNF